MFTLHDVTPATTLAEAATAYLEQLKFRVEVAGTKSPGTYRCRARGLQHYLDAKIGALRLGDLRRSDVTKWAARLALRPREDGQRGVARSADRIGLVSLSAMLTWCAGQHDDLAILPMHIRGIRWEYFALPGRAYTWSELDALRAELVVRDRPPRGRREHQTSQVAIRILRVLADNGARSHEIRDARLSQFSAERGCIVWERVKKKPRVVLLSEASQAICRAQAQRPEVKLTGYLFPSPVTGRPMTIQPLNRLHKRIAAACGLTEPTTAALHDYRRTMATLAAEAMDEEGNPLVTVDDIARALGNTRKMVEERYICTAILPGVRKVNAIINPPSANTSRIVRVA